ncbi:MAG: phosphoribosylformylglycinamidine synthase subunit PurL [Cyanobacteriota bacterium]|nr:phosphoribosylformylglycinamidine synthase subunit PurL [Cyanobacteriota bacterium]
MTYTAAQLKARGLTPSEYQMIVERLQRDPNPHELAMFGVMWSEHCCYKNSRPFLKNFPTQGSRILVGPGENAGVVDLGDGDHLAFKIESHNHPSAVEPFQGAATGVGGILRDIFTMGARPIALLNSLRFGSLQQPRQQQLLAGVVSGIAHYGNCAGIPTVGGEMAVDACYGGNPLVNVMALGLMETPTIIKSGAAGVGNPVLYVGSTTGRDGMGGASFASAELSADSQQDRPAVQVGDPFLGKCLIEACLEAFQTGAVVAAQDMGAAGITCSTSEMAARGGLGITFDLDRVPVRETGMQPWEFLLSESQERMLLVAQAGREGELIDIFHRWGLQAVVAGEVIAEPMVRIWHQGSIAAEIPATALADNTPVYHRPILSEPPDYIQKAWQWDPDHLPSASPSGITLPDGHNSWSDILLKLLASPTIASKQWIYRQYDQQVQNNTVILPGGGDAAVLRIRSSTIGVGSVPVQLSSPSKAVAATLDGNGRWVYLDPYEGAKAAVAEAARNLSCVGSEPLAVTDNLNFGNPEHAVVYWQLAEACRGIADACRALGTPITGGNVSLYNETLTEQGSQAIYPTPVIGMVGLIENLDHICGQAWQAVGDAIYLLGGGATSLGGSEYLALIHQQVMGRPAPVDLDLEGRIQRFCRHQIQAGMIRSAHDCSEGGLAVVLAEACLGSNLGASLTLPANPQRRWDEILFGEGGCRIVVTCPAPQQLAWQQTLEQHLGQDWCYLGSVTPASQGLTIQEEAGSPLIALSLAQLQQAFELDYGGNQHP